jgi:hypothetical protein
MATNFPGSVDNFSNPNPTDSLNAPSHSSQHTDANDAIEAIETYVLDNPSGLVHIQEVTIGTTVSTIDIDNVFTSKYTNYKVLLTVRTASAPLNILVRFRENNNTDINANYFYNFIKVPFSGATSLLQGNAQTSVLLSQIDATGFYTDISFDVFRPQQNERTAIISLSQDTANVAAIIGGANYRTAKVFDGFRILTSTGTITGGTLKVYGYKD